ncbi:hypothetical protein JCM13664_10800 [Methylothermus subterraneus]
MKRQVLYCLALGLGLAVVATPAMAAPPWIFHPSTADVPTPLKSAPKVIPGRSRSVQLDPAAIDADNLALNLFDDTVLTAVRDRIEIVKGSRVWIGHIEGEPDSEVVLAVRGKAMMGTVQRGEVGGNQAYEIVYAGGDTHVVRQIDPNKVAPHVDPIPVPEADLQGTAADNQTSSGTPQTSAAASSTVVDVMVVYTPKARANAGGVDGINAKIANAIARTNQAYLNSQINMQLNLVHTAEVSYTEIGNMTDALYALQGTSDGKMDVVHSWRDQYGADLVALISADSNYCGIGFVMQNVSTSFAPYAFAVSHDDSRYNCLGNTTLAHEFGHNQGNMHDPDNSAYPGAYPYSYGYRVCNVFRDVMSYNCSGEKQIQYFSNPNVYYNGYATGVENYQDTARSMNNTAPTVASFRPAQATSAPNAPSNLSASAQSESIQLTWIDNASNESGFKIERSLDGQSFAQIATLGENATSFIDTGLTASTTYYYRVRAYNGVGDSAFSNIAQATTQAAVQDTVPPRVAISSPPDGSKVGTKVTIKASASDNVGVASLQLLIDGKLVASTNTSSLSYNWNTRSVSPGTHTIRADAVDTSGNGASQTVSVIK